MRQYQKAAMLWVGLFMLLSTGCAATILNDSEKTYPVPDRPGYTAISDGVLAKLIKCCESCLDKEGAK